MAAKVNQFFKLNTFIVQSRTFRRNGYIRKGQQITIFDSNSLQFRTPKCYYLGILFFFEYNNFFQSKALYEEWS